MKTATKIKAEASRLFSDLDKPSLHALSYILRHPDTWPKGFVWNFDDCETCAMGLAHRLWKIIPPTKNKTAASIMANTFAIPYEAADSIFMGNNRGYPASWLARTHTEPGFLWGERTYRNPVSFDNVTPEMIADEIDKYLTTAE